MYKAILWDNDGILVDTEKWYFEATRLVMRDEGFNLTLNQYQETFLKENTGAWHLLKNTDKDYHTFLRLKRNTLYSTFIRSNNIINEHVHPILDKLHKKYKMGIVTSSRKDHFDIIHANSNLLHYFEFVITSDDFTHSKPDPEPYLLGIKQTSCKPFECVAIEDSERGVSSAKKANLFCFAIPNKMTKNSNFKNADILLDKIEDILNYL